MATAGEVITRALRKINVPGRGALLAGADTQAALERLQGILASEAVARVFQPGIRRHFFALTSGRAIYSYGPGFQLDTNSFEDPTPIGVEKAFLRLGGVITSNQQVTNGDLNLATGWTLGAGWVVANGQATISAGNAGSVLSQTLGLTAGRTYRLKVSFEHRAGSVTLALTQDATDIVSQVISGSGEYEFTATFSGSASTVTFTADATADMDVLDVSIIEDGLDPVSLVEGLGTDWPLTAMTQEEYNLIGQKHWSGTPQRYLFSRDYPDAEIRFDQAAGAAQIVVLDVRVNRQSVTSTSSTIRLHPEAIHWLEYKLADEMAGEYGKMLQRRQIDLMNEAWSRLAAAGARPNNLQIDRGLLGRRRYYNIEGGY